MKLFRQGGWRRGSRELSFNMAAEEAAYLVLYRRRRQRQTERRFWVHPILRDKLTHGHFVSLYPKARQHEDNFLNYFRMSVKSVVSPVSPHISTNSSQHVFFFDLPTLICWALHIPQSSPLLNFIYEKLGVESCVIHFTPASSVEPRGN
jgi:hypothetical protein